MELLLAAFTAYISEYFILALIWIVAAVLSLSRWRQHPKVSRLTLIAILLFLAESLVSVFATLYLPLMLRSAGWADGIPTLYYTLTGLSSSVIRAVAWSLLVAAIFSERNKV